MPSRNRSSDRNISNTTNSQNTSNSQNEMNPVRTKSKKSSKSSQKSNLLKMLFGFGTKKRQSRRQRSLRAITKYYQSTLNSDEEVEDIDLELKDDDTTSTRMRTLSHHSPNTSNVSNASNASNAPNVSNTSNTSIARNGASGVYKTLQIARKRAFGEGVETLMIWVESDATLESGATGMIHIFDNQRHDLKKAFDCVAHELRNQGSRRRMARLQQLRMRLFPAAALGTNHLVARNERNDRNDRNGGCPYELDTIEEEGYLNQNERKNVVRILSRCMVSGKINCNVARMAVIQSLQLLPGQRKKLHQQVEMRIQDNEFAQMAWEEFKIAVRECTESKIFQTKLIALQSQRSQESENDEDIDVASE